MTVRYGIDGVGSHALAHFARLGIDGRRLVEHPENTLVEPDIDSLSDAIPVPRDERHQRTDRGIGAGDIVGQRRGTGNNGRTAGLSREIGQSAEAVRHARIAWAIAIWTVLAIGRNAHEDQLGLQLLEHGGAQSPLLECARPEVLDHHVALLDETLHERIALGLAQIERDRLLVSGFVEPVESRASRCHGPEASPRITDTRNLELDHLGAELSQNARAVRRSDHRRHVQNTIALQRQRLLRRVRCVVQDSTPRIFGSTCTLCGRAAPASSRPCPRSSSPPRNAKCSARRMKQRTHTSRTTIIPLSGIYFYLILSSVMTYLSNDRSM